METLLGPSGAEADPETQKALNQIMADFADMPNFFWSMLPPFSKPIKGFRVKLRYASAKITDISQSGLITLITNEPVVLVNNGDFINPDLLDLKFIKQSNEDVQMVSWNQTKYEKT